MGLAQAPAALSHLSRRAPKLHHLQAQRSAHPRVALCVQEALRHVVIGQIVEHIVGGLGPRSPRLAPKHQVDPLVQARRHVGRLQRLLLVCGGGGGARWGDRAHGHDPQLWAAAGCPSVRGGAHRSTPPAPPAACTESPGHRWPTAAAAHRPRAGRWSGSQSRCPSGSAAVREVRQGGGWGRAGRAGGESSGQRCRQEDRPTCSVLHPNTPAVPIGRQGSVKDKGQPSPPGRRGRCCRTRAPAPSRPTAGSPRSSSCRRWTRRGGRGRRTGRSTRGETSSQR